MDIEKKISAKECVELIKTKQISAKELTKKFLSRSKELNKIINSLITICEDEALERAEYIDKNFNKFKDKKLVGVPISVKDAINTKDILTTAGSKILKNFIPPKSAFVIDKLLDEGAIITSKSNCDEFAMGSSNETSQYGPCNNPWNINKVPGGSSGGSAASVASSQNLLSIGSDTGGSIRQPAALCGVVGLKPTYGTVSRNGLIAFGSSLDQIGPFSKNVEDCEILYDSIKGHDKDDLTSVKKYSEIQKLNIKDLKIGICKELAGEGISQEVNKHFNNTIDELKKLGAKVEYVSVPYIKESLPVYYLTAPSEASSNLNRYDGIKYGLSQNNYESSWEVIKNTRSNFGEEVKRRILLGTFALSSGYYDEYYGKAQKVRGMIVNSFKNVFKDYNILISPTTPTTAFDLGSMIDDPLTMYQNDICTMPANIAGIPAISIPCGVSEGLPIGFQIMGPHFSDNNIISVAKELENHLQLNILESLKI
ncbi:MAG: Asp-tRNA(Asn)/Glu-tRNA(Gln) amidotransferase subunit GatA [Chloroflexi bacterium]|nr:Asp-tRNA(Asn)/Glu-tRNA(Gln) amidotransferase subunit GatA [Chloroflexota bacterium]|tara:strand:+ start:2151 stop:3596 length:1446 start_codon:yes stop_codon:yes gene_type:complete